MVKPAEHSRVFGLDVLRASAIAAVTFAHSFAVLYPHHYWLGVFGHGGFYGVELFFVLSGFLIGQILIRTGDGLAEGRRLGEFYVRRWFRTLPLFWLLLIANVVLDRVLVGAQYPIRDVLPYAFFLRNLAAPHLLFVPESWSLAVEEWFYLLFPAVLWLGLKLRARFDVVFLAAAAGFYSFSTYLRWHTAQIPEANWEWQRLIVLHRFDAIMIGILAAWVATRFPDAWRRWAKPCAVAGVVLSLAMYATLWRIDGSWIANAADTHFARTWRFNLVSLSFALLLPAASGWTLARETFSSVWIRRIALWSYAIYLVQHPFSRLVMHYGFSDWQHSAAQAWGLFAVVLIGTVAVSAALHYSFEAPCTRVRERFRAPGR